MTHTNSEWVESERGKFILWLNSKREVKTENQIADYWLGRLLSQKEEVTKKSDSLWFKDMAKWRQGHFKYMVKTIQSMKETYSTSNNGKAPYDEHGYNHACDDVIRFLIQSKE